MIVFHPWQGNEAFPRLKQIDIVLVPARYRGQWVLVKSRPRGTWEIPGGHRQLREPLGLTACRELYEETGAKHFSIAPVALYEVEQYAPLIEREYRSLGALFLAEIEELGELPPYEVMERLLTDRPPSGMSFPHVQYPILEYLTKNRL